MSDARNGSFHFIVSAAILLAITPGPGIFYVLARSLAGGRREGILSSLGTFLGGLAHVMAAALGLSALLAAPALAPDQSWMALVAGVPRGRLLSRVSGRRF